MGGLPWPLSLLFLLGCSVIPTGMAPRVALDQQLDLPLLNLAPLVHVSGQLACVKISREYRRLVNDAILLGSEILEPAAERCPEPVSRAVPRRLSWR